MAKAKVGDRVIICRVIHLNSPSVAPVPTGVDIDCLIGRDGMGKFNSAGAVPVACDECPRSDHVGANKCRPVDSRRGILEYAWCRVLSFMRLAKLDARRRSGLSLDPLELN